MASDKEIFFRELDNLDSLTNDDTDADDQFARILKTSRKPVGFMGAYSAITSSAIPPRLARIQSTPGSSVVKSASKEVSCVDRLVPDTARNNRGRPKEMKRSLPSCNSEGPEERVKKRRAESFKLVPESQQIFKGLTFFFIPNNDVAPARRLRIAKAQEYGALWARVWSSDVTHVIVDKDLVFQDVLKVVDTEKISANIALVNQDYPSECLRFRSILKVAQSRFRIKGTPLGDMENVSPALSGSMSDASLPLKPPQRRGQHSPTPSPIKTPEQNRTAESESRTSKHKGKNTRLSLTGPNACSDPLDELMTMVKAAADLPMDEKDDLLSFDSSIDILDIPGSGSTAQSSNSDAKVPEWQKNFTCMQKHQGGPNASNPNARTIEILQKMLDYYSRTADQWRTIAYRKAITALRKQPTKIATKAQALGIAGIGERLADKIEEIVSTDRLRRLENTSLTPEDKALQLFLGVYGAGFTQASKWVAKGFRSLEDLRTKAELSKNQQIGVERYHDFQERIPRAEVELHGKIVAHAIHEADADMNVIIGGSFRRGAVTSGDIDVLITKPNATLESIRGLMLDAVVPQLFKQGFLKVSLATSSREDGSKWHGASTLPDSDIWRRIDLLFVPGDEIGAALLYFTGNDIFNRSMRLLASKKGMCLNQRGLFADVLRGPNRVKANAGRLVEGRDEKRIFEILGVPWRPPEHRVC